MHTSLMKSVAASALFVAATGFASPADRGFSLPKASPRTAATCNCRNASDCTCPKGKCACKGCGSAHTTMFESLKGTTETTRLPETARVEDARGGVLL